MLSEVSSLGFEGGELGGNRCGVLTAIHRTKFKCCGYEGYDGAPGMIRTCDPLIRSQVLYPAELRVPEANY